MPLRPCCRPSAPSPYEPGRLSNYLTTAPHTLAFLDTLCETLNTRRVLGMHAFERLFAIDNPRPYLPREVTIRDVA